MAIEAFREAGAGSYIDASYGYAVFPSIGKIGLLVGGAQGKGMVYQEGKPIGKATMTQVSLGFQFGGQVVRHTQTSLSCRIGEERGSGEA